MIIFRVMTPEDAAAVAEIERLSFAVPWSRQAFWEEAGKEQALYILAVEDEQIIGYAGAWLVLDEAQVTNVAMLPARRGQGVGHQLLRTLMERARERGATRMTLEVRPSNQAALALYKDCGFQEYGRRRGYYQDNGEDAIIMWNMAL